MKRIVLAFISLVLLAPAVILAQNELVSNPTAALGSKKQRNAVQVSFASSNQRYAQDELPTTAQAHTWNTKGWRGEKIHTQVLVWSAEPIDKLQVELNDLKSAGGGKIRKEHLQSGFVKYVMTDEFAGGCGYRKSVDFDSSLVADPIDTHAKEISVQANTVQPVWISVNIPANARPGVYLGDVVVKGRESTRLQVAVTVIDQVLPPARDWKFQLDLWQHPASIARVHRVPLWSELHFKLMKKYYTMLASAGQKNITVSIVNEPWGHQTYDDYPSLVKWTKKKDGSWVYDYSLFDKYVSFVMDCGITQRINCYSMVPWKIAFQYYDESLGKDTVFTQAIGTPAYNEFWKSMLVDFTRHLKRKGWFSKAVIAMDERPMEQMQFVIKLLKEVDSAWKLALAGEYHPEIEKDIDDYCIASRWQFPSDTLQIRQQQGKKSTWYTCCTENYPNGFTFSPPAEHVWIGWYTAAKNMDGYLRWAYNSWTADPMHDSRFTAWPAGDTYQVYPGPLSSIRFEKLIEGIQDFEKIRILKDQYTRAGDTEKLKKLEEVLNGFEIERLSSVTSEEMVERARLEIGDL